MLLKQKQENESAEGSINYGKTWYLLMHEFKIKRSGDT